jgi:hypothetical protein
MKTLHTYISEKLLINKNSEQMSVCFHPDYDELQKKKPKFNFDDNGICDSILNLLWSMESNNDDLKLDYPGFDHDVDGDDPQKSFKNKLEKCGSLHSICHVLNEKWSDEENLSEDDRWEFYSSISSWYEELGYFEKPYHCKDLEHYIIYNDKRLTNELLNGSWL